MNESKRRFMKVAPLAALAGMTIEVGSQKAEVVEVQPNKRYVFKLPDYVSVDDHNKARRVLDEKGFKDALLISGPTEIFELA